MKKIETSALIGLGALGILFGRKMPGVKVIADAERVARYSAQPVVCNGKECHFDYVTPEQGQPVDLVLVAVKATVLEQAIKDIKKFVGPDTIIISVLNGITSENDIEAVYPGRCLWSVAIGMDATRVGRSLTFGAEGRIQFGEKSGEMTDRVKAVDEYLTACGIASEPCNDILFKQWSKLMVNDGLNQAAAAFDLPYGGLTKPGPAYDKMLEAMQEVIDLSVLEGVNLPADNHRAFLESMAPTFKPDGMPSMRQDVLAKRPTEVEQFAGVVRRLAQKHGMPTPANDFFYEKIREIERTLTAIEAKFPEAAPKAPGNGDSIPADSPTTPGDGDKTQKFPAFEGKDLNGNPVKSDDLFSKNAVTVSAAQTVGAMEGDNPHLWFSKDARTGMAKELVNAFSKALPAKKKAFSKRYDAWLKREQAIEDKMAAFAKDHANPTYAATEAVAYYLMSDMGFKDLPPEGYAASTASEGEPAPADLQAFQKLVEGRGVDLLVNNTQEASDATNLVTGTAGRSEVPVFDVSEQMPKDKTDLTDWIDSMVDAIDGIFDERDAQSCEDASTSDGSADSGDSNGKDGKGSSDGTADKDASGPSDTKGDGVAQCQTDKTGDAGKADDSDKAGKTDGGSATTTGGAADTPSDPGK